MGIFPLLSLAFDSESLKFGREASVKLYKSCLLPLLLKQTNLTWSITWVWRCSWVKLYFFVCVHRLLPPGLWISATGFVYCSCLEIRSWVGASVLSLLWGAQGSRGLRHPLNNLQLYWTKTPGLKWEMFVVWISVGAHWEGYEESLVCFHFYYCCSLCRDVTPSQMMWAHFWKTLCSHIFYTNSFSVSGQSTNAMKNGIYW